MKLSNDWTTRVGQLQQYVVEHYHACPAEVNYKQFLDFLLDNAEEELTRADEYVIKNKARALFTER